METKSMQQMEEILEKENSEIILQIKDSIKKLNLLRKQLNENKRWLSTIHKKLGHIKSESNNL